MRLILLASLLLSSPVWAQQNNDIEAQEVYSSPLPKVRVVRPATPTEQVAVPVLQSETTDDSDTPKQIETVEQPLTIPQVPVPSTQQPEDPPRVVFGVARTDPAGEKATTEGADEEGKTRSRFKRPPKRRVIEKLEVPAIAVPIEPARTQLQGGARLRQLDKMTGQTETFDIGVGESRRVARLQILLEACRAPNDNDTHGTMAFIKVWDTKYEGSETAFTGWMFAESPALSALDHPRYDLWVISCTTS